VNSTETPGGSGIPAGWYDDPSGAGLRWWDGEQWTEHVHTAESAAAAAGTTDGSGSASREGKPPRDLVKLRERIRARGIKGVGIVLGAIVVVIVVIALLVSGGSDNSSNATPPQGGTPAGKTAKASATQAQIKAIDKRLKNKNLSKKQKKALEAKKKRLQKAGSGNKGKSAAKKQGEAKKEVSPGEEGN
jgi:Protein of unknown function (DUF2510)